MQEDLLKVSNITKIYDPGTPGEICALHNVSFDVACGDFITVIGNNAAGKSTLFDILVGRIPLTNGDVFLNGESILKEQLYKRAKYISCIRQNPNEGVFLSMTILENFCIAKSKGASIKLQTGTPKSWREECAVSLAYFNLGLENRLDNKVRSLSGGQKQIMALLMTTIVTPRLLLLDEHTASLDPATSEKVLKLTNDLVQKHKITTLMITHNINHAIQYGNRLLLMERGIISFQASSPQKQALTITDVVGQMTTPCL